MRRARIAILVGPRGRGSNMRAIVQACRRDEVPADVVVVVTPKSGTPAAIWALEAGIPLKVLPSSDPEYGAKLLSILRTANATYVCLAGYLRLLPRQVIEAYPSRVLNIHPALLPKFGGKGMYGEAVHRAVLEAGERESGCTVHLVNEKYDEGRVILQLRCPVLPEDTPETLAARVLELEHRAYPEALRRVIAEHGP